MIATNSFMKLFQQSFYYLRMFAQQVRARVRAFVQFLLLRKLVLWCLPSNLHGLGSVLEKRPILDE